MGAWLVHIDQFWQIVEQARADAPATDDRFDVEAFRQALTDRLATLSKDEILDFADYFSELRSLGSWEMCAACYLINGQISDDTFDYFKRGVIALGREAFERFTVDPDSLAGDPVVAAIADGRLKRSTLVAEEVGWAALEAYTRLGDSDDEAYWEALEARSHASKRRQPPDTVDWDGRFGVPGDLELIPIRVPRLSALFPLPTTPR